MRLYFKTAWRVLRSSWMYMIALVLSFVAVNGYIASQYDLVVVGEVALYLSLTQYVGIFLFVLFSFLTYEYEYQVRDVMLEESVSIYSQARLKLRICQSIFMVVGVFVFFITVFLYDLQALSTYDMCTSQVMKHIICCCVLNIFLVGVVAVLLGMMLSLKFHRPGAFAIIVAFSLLMSPVGENVFASLSLPQDVMEFDLARVLDVFRLTAPDVFVYPDSNYGLAIENCRWDIAFFWILFSVAIIGIWSFDKNKKSRFVSYGCFLLSVLCFFSFMQMGTDSVVRMDSRTYGTVGQDSIYESLHEGKDQEADFSVTKYTMELKIRRNLYAKVSMEVTESESGQYLFTLYRGYKVLSVVDEDGNELSYERDGHYLSVDCSNNDPQKIIITYRGTGNRWYSNYQAVGLVGDFPWYPKAGYYSIWNETANTFYPETDDDDTYYEVSVDSSLSLVSNLDAKDENVFCGYSNHMTLIGGLIEEKEVNGISYYAPVLQTAATQLEQFQSDVETAEEKLGISLGIDFYNTKFIYLPRTVSAIGGGEDIAVFDDCILISDMDAFYSYMKKLFPEKEYADELEDIVILTSAGYEENIYGDGEEIVYPMDYESLSVLTKNIETVDSEAYYEAQCGLEQFYDDLVETYGEKKVLYACYQYCISDTQLNEVDFLYQLKEKLEDET